MGINYTSPFADIAILLGMNWLAILLYMDAFVSPFGTGVAFVATASRALAAMNSYRTFAPMVGTARTALHDSAVCNGCGSDFSSGNG